MTRRAKELRKERMNEKRRLNDEKEEREIRLRNRPEWLHLLATIDGKSELKAPYSMNYEKFIVDALQWKSTEVPIAASSIFELPLTMLAAHGRLAYEFSTHEFDINFGAHFIAPNGERMELLPVQRYSSQHEPVIGVLQLEGPGLIVLYWDNTYSWMNMKQLAYSIELKQELPLESEQKRLLIAREALEFRQEKLFSTIHSYNEIQQDLIAYEDVMQRMKQKMMELEIQLTKKEEEKQELLSNYHSFEEQIADLQWEVQALTWRCLDKSSVFLILSYLGIKELIVLSRVNHKWAKDVENYRNTRLGIK